MKALLRNYKTHFSDIGAAGGIDSTWNFLESNLIEILFEPDHESFLELEKSKKGNSRDFISALSGIKKEVILNICQWRQVSSVNESNFDFIKNFLQLERIKVIERIKMLFIFLLEIFNDNKFSSATGDKLGN